MAQAGDNLWQQIPDDVLAQEKTQAQAESWAAEQRAKLAEIWAQTQRQALNLIQDTWAKQAVNIAAPATASPSSSYANAANTREIQGANPNLASGNSQSLNGGPGPSKPLTPVGATGQNPDGQELPNDLTDPGWGKIDYPTQDPNNTQNFSSLAKIPFSPVPSTPAITDDAMLKTNAASPLPTGNTATSSGDFVGAMREGASHAGIYLPPTPGEKVDLQKEIALQQQAEQNKTRPFVGPAGVSLANPALNPEGGKTQLDFGEAGHAVGSAIEQGAQDLGAVGKIAAGVAKFAVGAEGEGGKAGAVPSSESPALQAAKQAAQETKPAVTTLGGRLYSQAAQIIQDKIPNKATGDQIYKTLVNSGVKPTELDWTGLKDWLTQNAGRVIPKTELQDFINKNNVQIQEIARGADIPGKIESSLPAGATVTRENGEWVARNELGVVDGAGDSEEEATQDALKNRQRIFATPSAGRSKYRTYSLPGGQDYRELLLTLPMKEAPKPAPITELPPGFQVTQHNGEWEVGATNGELLAANENREAAIEDAIARLNQRAEQERLHSSGENYLSPHWDEPNILAHVRFDERTDPQGKPTLFIQEVQSDWGQSFRKIGAVAPELTRDQENRLIELRSAPRQTLSPEDQNELDALENQRSRSFYGTPPAPFIGNTADWTKLAFKRMVSWAAENGFDRIAWTTGAQQADRYNLSEQVDSLQLLPMNSNGAYRLLGRRGTSLVVDQTLTPKELPEYVGQEIADKLLNPKSASNENILSGQDLQVGGSGMRGYYDQILPSVARDLGKKYGAQLQDIPIRTTSNAGAPQESEKEIVHSMTIPPAMKEAALKGQQLFAAAPAVAAATPQQPGESDEDYHRRVAIGQVGTGLALAGTLRRSNTPALQSLFDMYNRLPKDPSYLSSLPASERLGRALVRNITDNGVDIDRLQKDIVGNTPGPDEMAAQLRLMNPGGAADMRIKQELAPVIQSVGDLQNYLSGYLALRHNVEVSQAKNNAGRMFPGGLTSGDSVNRIQDMLNELGPQDFQRVVSAAQQVTDYTKRLLQTRVDAGVISQEMADTLTKLYPHYVPIKIQDYMYETAQNLPSGKSLSLGSDGIKKLTQLGTSKDQEDPLASVIRLTYQTEAMAAKNRTFNALVNLRDMSPDLQTMMRPVDQKFSPTRTEALLEGFVNGEKQMYAVPRDWAAAVQASTTSILPELQQVMAVQRGLLASNNPLFVGTHAAITIIPSVIRMAVHDTAPLPLAIPRTIGALSAAYLDVAKDIISGRAFQGRYAADFERYLRQGGAMFPPRSVSSPEEAQTALKNYARPNYFTVNSLDDIKRIILGTYHGTGELINRVDMAPRVAAMRQAESRGANAVEATTEGRTISTDFAKGGNVTKVINQFVPFFNVGVQAVAQVGRTIQENPARALGTFTAVLAAPTAAAEAWNRSDPQRSKDYDDVPDYYKNQGIVIMTASRETDQSGNVKPGFIVIPTRAYTPFVMLTRDILTRAMGHTPETWRDLLNGALDSENPAKGLPLGSATSLYVAARTGRDVTTGGNIESKSANRGAGAVANAVARGINLGERLTGGLPQAQPADAQYAEDQLGGPGRLIGSIGRPSGEGQPVVPFLRYAGGQGLTTAREQRLGPNLSKLLGDLGKTQFANASTTISGLTLTQKEEAELQSRENANLENMATEILRDPQYATLTSQEKEAYVVKRMTAERRGTALQFLSDLGQRDPAGIQQRFQQARQAKAG